MKSAIKTFIVTFLAINVLIYGTMWLARVEVHDPEVCKDNTTLATEVVRRIEADEMKWYQMLYCPEMEDRWGASYVKAE